MFPNLISGPGILKVMSIGMVVETKHHHEKWLEGRTKKGNGRSFGKPRYLPNFVSLRGGLQDLLCLRVRREHTIIWPHRRSALSTTQQMTQGATHSSIATWQGWFGPLRMMMFLSTYLLMALMARSFG
jgi:hypothetical protein